MDEPKSKKKNKTWIWVAVGGGALLLYLMNRNSSATASSTTMGVAPALGATSTMPLSYGSSPPSSTAPSTSAQTGSDMTSVMQAMGAMENQIQALAAVQSQSSQQQQQATNQSGQTVNGKPPSTHVVTAVTGFTASSRNVGNSQVANIGKNKAVANAFAGTKNTNVVDSPAKGGYVVAQGGASYNNAVNSAGGQWINHQWASGSYNGNGVFVAANSQSQAVYNNYEKSHGRNARAVVK